MSHAERDSEATQIDAMRAESSDRVTQATEDVARLREILEGCNKIVASDSDRKSSVDARLSTIVGLSSIAGTIVFGTLLAANYQAPYAGFRKALAVLLVYLTLQVCVAIIAAVRGLGRRGYLASVISDILPTPSETTTAHLKRQINISIKMLDQNRTLTNRKVTLMAVAHRAIANFASAILILAIAAAGVAIFTAPSDPLLERLKQNRQLTDSLRGPQGPPGPTGPPGPATPAPTIGKPLSHRKNINTSKPLGN
jgi:hypothetical protein